MHATKTIEESSQQRLDMVNEWKGKYNNVVEELEEQCHIFKALLEEKDVFIQELTMEIAEKDREMEAMEFDLDSAVEAIHVSNSTLFLL